MGQKLSQECGCQEYDVFKLCTPEDPEVERRAQLEPRSNPSYPNTASERPASNGHGYPESPPVVSDNTLQRFGEDTGDEFAFAPPPENSRGPYADDPVPPPADARPSPEGSAARGGAAASAAGGVTAEQIIRDVEGSEERLYGDAFKGMPGGRTGFLALDCAAARDFICTYSVITMDEIDMELLKVAAPEEGLSLHGFLSLLREFAVSESDAIQEFLHLGGEGRPEAEGMASEECRTALLIFGQQRLSTNFADDRWESVLDSVMASAGPEVPMEQWIGFCKHMARICRLTRLAQV